MAGLLDFLMQGQGGGGLLGFGQQQPMNIQPPQQQAGLMMQQPQGIDPQMFARMVQPQQPSMFDNPLVHLGLGLAGGNTAGEGISNGLKGLQGYQASQQQQQQQALANYVGLTKLQLEQKAAEEKPQYQKLMGADGQEHIVLLQPYGRGANYVNPQGAPPTDPTLPAGVNGKAVAEARGKAFAANEEDAVKSAKAAADLQPHINEMHDAYDAAIKAGAIGPVMGSAVERANEKYNPLMRMGLIGNPQAEAARQRYEIAKSAVQARITAAQNKGEGAVSNYERSMYAAQFPELTAMDPETQIKTLRQIRDQNQQTIAAGKIPSIGQAPQVGAVLNRPAVAPPAAPMNPPGPPPQAGAPPQAAPASPSAPAIAPPSAPIKVTAKAQFDMLPAGSLFIAPDGTTRRKP